MHRTLGLRLRKIDHQPRRSANSGAHGGWRHRLQRHTDGRAVVGGDPLRQPNHDPRKRRRIAVDRSNGFDLFSGNFRARQLHTANGHDNAVDGGVAASERDSNMVAEVDRTSVSSDRIHKTFRMSIHSAINSHAHK